MKRVVSIFLCILFANATYAQLTKSQEGYIEKKIAEGKAKAKKEREAEERKEREERIKTERRHEEQRRQHEANYNRQMNNLNQVSASDFINTPQQQEGGFSTKVKKFREGQQTTNVVATPKKKNTNRPNGDPFANSGRIGSRSHSGNNYPGNTFDKKRAGFDNTQQRIQARVPANQIKRQYKPNRNMHQGVVNLQRTNAMPKAKLQAPPQQGNIAQRSQQQRDAQVVRNVQAQQRQQQPVQRGKVAWVEGGVKHLDSSKPIYITLQQNNSSNDLAMVDTRRIDYETKVNNITIYNVPSEALRSQKAKVNPAIQNEAPYLSDRDNKKPSKSGKGTGIKTDYELQQMQNKDMMSGMSSFDNRQKWERTYDYEPIGPVKTPARQVTKKR